MSFNQAQLTPDGDFRLYLQQELLNRCRKNPAYSLRAFSKNLQIEPSALSKILRGKRKLTPLMFRHLAKNLELDPNQAAALAPAGKNQTKTPAKDQYQQLSVDLFQAISNWYHYAMLELTQVKHFRADSKWIARTLGISVVEVNAATERLVRLKMLEITPGGKWIDRSGAITTVGNDFTTVAFRRLQREILEGGIAALENIPFERREQSSMTMAIDSKKIPEAKRRIKRFRRSLCQFLKAGSARDSVYQMSVSLYPVTSSIRSKQ